MFTVNRNDMEGGFLRNAGFFTGTIRFPKELQCTPSGETKIRLEFVTETGEKAFDDYINSPKLWWKLNLLLSAVDPDGSKIPVTDGSEVDFDKDQNFIAFVKRFDKMTLTFAGWNEDYVKKDGGKGTAYRVRPLDPRKGRNQLPVRVLDYIENAPPPQSLEPDEVPF